jgi:hypothetical protein
MKELMVEPEQLKETVTRAQAGDRQDFDEFVDLSRERLVPMVHARLGPHLRAPTERRDIQ